MKKRLFLTACLATLIAVGVHAYLLSVHYGLKFASSSESICNINDHFNCSAVAASRYAEFMGVPVALFGALANLALLIFALRWFFADESPKNIQDRRNARTATVVISTSIFIASLVMGSISAFALGTYCIMCIGAYVLSLISFVGFFANRNDAGPFKLSLDFVPILKALAITAVVVVVLGFIANQGIANSYTNGTDVKSLANNQVQEWLNNPQTTITPRSPLVLGAAPENAKMTIIEFADFLCPHCRVAGPVLHAFALSHSSDVRFLFQPWPLDGECNTSVKQVDGVRCNLARAVFCADKKSLGWPAHDWVYRHQELFFDKVAMDGLLKQMTDELHLDNKELVTCTQSAEAKEAIARSADLGTSLKIEGTPTIFVNGRQLPGAQFLPVLQQAYATIQNSK